LTGLACREVPHEFDQATSVFRPPGMTVSLRVEAAEGLSSARTLDQGHTGGASARDPPYPWLCSLGSSRMLKRAIQPGNRHIGRTRGA
jgi:hypothetical protein